MWEVILFGVLIGIFLNYEDVMFRLYQVYSYQSGRIVAINENNMWVNVDIEGRMYDLFIPYQEKVAHKYHIVLKDDADNEFNINHLSGNKFIFTIREMGFQSGHMSVVRRKKDKRVLGEDDYITL